MLKSSRLLLVALSMCLVAPGICAAAESTVPEHLAFAAPSPQGRARGTEEERVQKTITRWLRLYRNGKLMPGQVLMGTKSLLHKADLAHLRLGGAGGRGAPGARPGGGRTARSELEALVEAARSNRTKDSATLLLEVASVGIDRKTRYTSDMLPSAVRSVGERALVRMARGDIHDYLVAAAKGDPGGPHSYKLAMQIAALRVLSMARKDVDLRIYQEMLKHRDEVMRLSVAESLGRKGEGFCVEWLAEALGRENAPNAIIAMVWAVRDIHQRQKDRVKIEHLRRAVVLAGKHLTTTKDRPMASALVDFLERFRHQESVPVLIGLLERLQRDSSLARVDKLGSGMAKQVNDVLKAMTGAIYPKDDPAQWRAFWNAEGSKIDVTKVRKPQGGGGSGTASEFFGIPIRGKRIVFVIDVSGSMDWNMPQQSGGTSASRSRSGIRKIDKAKSELFKAVNALKKESKFNVVIYSNVQRTKKWRKSLVPASDRNKKSLVSSIRRERASGGTNLFGGLKLGLEMKSLVYGSRYESKVDEVFLLSDGCPTVGDVTDMTEILRLIGETNRYSGVRINCIYLGSNSDARPQGMGRSEREGGEFMKKLAKQNGGTFVWPIVKDDDKAPRRRR